MKSLDKIGVRAAAVLLAVLFFSHFAGRLQAGNGRSFAAVCDHDVEVVEVRLVEDSVVREFRNAHGDVIQEFASGRTRVLRAERRVVRREVPPVRIERRIATRTTRVRGNRVFASDGGALVNSNAQFGLININVR